MKMIVVTQCCCGCTVRAGTLIIAVLFAIMAALDFTFHVIIASHDEKSEEKGEEPFMSKGEAISTAVLSLMVFAVCLALIYGTLKERINFILAWLVVYSVYCVFMVLFIFQIVITVIIEPTFVQQLWEIPAILFILALSAYSLIVVYSHYRNLKDGVTLPPRTPVIITA